MIREGQYRARVIAHGWDAAKDGLCYVLELEVTRGGWAGSRGLLHLYWDGEGAKRSLPQLRRLGWTGRSLADLASADLGSHEVMIEVRPAVKKNDKGEWVPKLYQGKPEMWIEIARPWTPKAQIATERVQALAARLQGMLDATAPAEASAEEDGFG